MADVAKLIVIDICDITFYSIISNGWFVVCIWNFPLKKVKDFSLFFAEYGQDEDVLKASGLDGLMFLEFMSLGRRGCRWRC